MQLKYIEFDELEEFKLDKLKPIKAALLHQLD